MIMMMMMMMMIMNYFCGMADRPKMFFLSYLQTEPHCQRFLTLQISDTLGTGFEPEQNLKFRLSWMKLCSSELRVDYGAVLHAMLFFNFTCFPVDSFHDCLVGVFGS